MVMALYKIGLLAIYDIAAVTKNYLIKSVVALCDNPECLIICHMSSSMVAGLKEFYCILTLTIRTHFGNVAQINMT